MHCRFQNNWKIHLCWRPRSIFVSCEFACTIVDLLCRMWSTEYHRTYLNLFPSGKMLNGLPFCDGCKYPPVTQKPYFPTTVIYWLILIFFVLSRVEVRVVCVGWLSFYEGILIRRQKRFFKAVYTLVMKIDVSL